MPTTADVHQKEFFNRLVAAICQSGHLNDAVLAYVDKALFPPTPAALTAFLIDETDCERETLLDLIFSPDLSVQVNLEPLVEKVAFSPEKEKRLEAQLFAREIVARLQLPDGRQLLSMVVPGELKVRYLRQLNISWQLDPRIRSAIETAVTPQRRPEVKVKLRNAGIQPPGHHRTFLCRLFEQLDDGDPRFMAGLDLALALLAPAKPEEDIYQLFAAQKHALFRTLQQTKRFADLLARSNMETLMLQGIRAPQASTDQLVGRMGVIDWICFAVFGKTEIIAQPMEAILRDLSDLMGPGPLSR